MGNVCDLTSLSLLPRKRWILFSSHLCQLPLGTICPQPRINTVIDTSHHLHHHLYFSVIHCVSSTETHTVHVLFLHFITTPLKDHHCPYFIDDKTEAPRNNVPHPAGKWLSRDLNPGGVTDSKTHVNPVSMMSFNHLFCTHQRLPCSMLSSCIPNLCSVILAVHLLRVVHNPDLMIPQLRSRPIGLSDNHYLLGLQLTNCSMDCKW